MTKQTLGILILGTLAACSPQPRSSSYFEAHPEEAALVVADCAAGKHRGDECVNAKAGDAEVRRKARMDAYKKNF
jgi:hypothetical protein